MRADDTVLDDLHGASSIVSGCFYCNAFFLPCQVNFDKPLLFARNYDMMKKKPWRCRYV
jgi:hypothetical protein